MSMVSPTLNLPKPGIPSSAAGRTASVAAPPAPAAAPAPQARTPDVPGTIVTLSPQALSALAAADHPASAVPIAPAAAHDSSGYESLKSSISTAARDVGDAVADGAHAVVEGVETTLSMANKVAKGALELPFAAVAKGCDAMGGLIDEL
jgi:hypothetical protein